MYIIIKKCKYFIDRNFNCYKNDSIKNFQVINEKAWCQSIHFDFYFFPDI